MAQSAQEQVDVETLKALNAKLVADTNDFNSFSDLLTKAKTALTSGQNDLATANSFYSDIFRRRDVLGAKWTGRKISSDKWNGKSMQGKDGDNYYVGPNDNEIWGNTPGFQTLQQQYGDGIQAVKKANEAISAANTQVTTNTALVKTAHDDIADDTEHIVGFKSTTPAGQATQISLAQSAVQIAGSAADTAKSQGVITGNQKDLAKEVQTGKSNITMYIVGGVVLVVIIVVLFLFKKKK